MGNFWDEVQNMADEAPEAGFPALNYGKLEILPQVLTWETTKTDSGDVRTPKRIPLKEGQSLKEGEALELMFKVNISELNPKLEFDYERNVTVRKSRPGVQLTDWSETVLPSLIATFGEHWAKSANGTYVEVEDVPQVNESKTGKVYKTCKFLRKFAGKDECVAARNAVYKSAGSSETSSSDIPDEVITQAEALVKSVGKDAARGALEGKPFGDYDPDAILAKID